MALANEYVILSAIDNDSFNDISRGYIREFIRHGALYVDYEELYIKLGQKGAQEEIERILERENKKVLIYQSVKPTDFYFSLAFFAKLRHKYFLVMTLSDADHYLYSRDIYYAQCMDLVVVYNCLSRYIFQQYGINAVSFYSSFDKNLYRKIPDIQKDIAISFVGDISVKMRRKEYIHYLRDKGIDTKIFGTGSQEGQLPPNDMVRVFNRSKINLNFTGISRRTPFGYEPNINQRMRQIKGRIAEIALSGGFVMSEYAPGMEEVFEIDKEIVVFSTQAELAEKVEYYLRHDSRRELIAENGYRRARKEYELGNAIPMLISKIENARSSKEQYRSEIYTDPVFVKKYSAFRVKQMVIFIRACSFKQALEEVWLILKSGTVDPFMALRFLVTGVFPWAGPLHRKLKRRISTRL